MRLPLYTDERAKNAFDDWLSSLDNQSFPKVFAAIVRMEQGNLGDAKSVGEGVLERRIHSGPWYRRYFGRDGEELVLLVVGGNQAGPEPRHRGGPEAVARVQAKEERNLSHAHETLHRVGASPPRRERRF